MMARTWILVAESSRAKLFAAPSRTSPLLEIEDLVNTEGRLHEGDLVSDSNGADSGSIGHGRHLVGNQTSAKAQIHINFAKKLAQRLATARTTGNYEQLVLIAPPTFLGLLRSNLSKEVMNLVCDEIGENLVQQPTERIRDQVKSDGILYRIQ